MVIQAIYDVVSNRDGYNFRMRPYLKDKEKWDRIGETINIKTYNKVRSPKELMQEIKKWFKYWFDAFTNEWKHHRWINTSFFYEF